MKSIITKHKSRRFPLALFLSLGVLFFLIGMYILNRGDAPQQRQYVTQQITMLPPPPPPPPPEEEKVIEPKEVVTPTEDAEVQEDVEEVVDNPSPDPSTSQPAGLNRSADIGSDSFGLAAGKGGGLFGRGGAGGSWEAYVATHIRRALQKDERTRIAAGYLEVLLSIAADGSFERAELKTSTGDMDLDTAIREVLSQLPQLSRGRPTGVKPLMVTGINLRLSER